MPLALATSAERFGWVSRLAHWTIAVLPAGSADRAGFLAAHQALGLLVIPLAALRLAWLLASPPPPAARGLPACGTPPTCSVVASHYRRARRLRPPH